MARHSKQLLKWKSMTDALRTAFESSKDSDHRKVVDFSIDLLHRTLDRFEVTADNEVLEDKVKDHIFESLDRIRTTSRTDSDALRLKASFDNWLVTNKLL
jgi:nitrogen-specific signal transduction histidine kinase